IARLAWVTSSERERRGILHDLPATQRVLYRHFEHGRRDVATMYPVYGRDVPAPEPVAALYSRPERDVRVVADEAHAHAGAESQVAVVGAEHDLGLLRA